MITALTIFLNVANASPQLQPAPASWVDQDPSQQTEEVDYTVTQTVTE